MVFSGSPQMVKKIRFQETRISRNRRRTPARGAWVLEPLDLALAGAAVVIVLWMQLVSATS